MRQLERLLELRPRAGAVAQVEQRLAQAQACERLASDGAHLAAEPRGVDQVRAGGLEVVGEELGLAEHGGAERLAAPRARLMGLRAQALGEAGDAIVGVARREHVLGHAQVGVEDTARELRRVPHLRELVPGVLLPAAVQVSEHRLEVGELGGVGRWPSASAASRRAVPRSPVCQATMPRSRVRSPRSSGRTASTPSIAALAPGEVARREAGSGLLRAQGRHALRGCDRDRLGIGGRGAGLAGAVQQRGAQRKEGRPLTLVRVLERELGPLGAVAVGTHPGGPLRRPCEERHGLPSAARPQQVVRHRLGRRVLRGEQRSGGRMGAAQRLLGQPGGQLFAHERVPVAIAAARALEHAGGLGLAEHLVDLPGPAERRELRGREAVLDHGERGEQPLAERVEPFEPPRHDLAQPRRHRDLARGVHRRRQLLREERIARRRALDGGEGVRRQRPRCYPLRRSPPAPRDRAGEAPAPPPRRARRGRSGRARPAPARARRACRRPPAAARRLRCARGDGRARPWPRQRRPARRSRPRPRARRRPGRAAGRPPRRRDGDRRAPRPRSPGGGPRAAVATGRPARCR